MLKFRYSHFQQVLEDNDEITIKIFPANLSSRKQLVPEWVMKPTERTNPAKLSWAELRVADGRECTKNLRADYILPPSRIFSTACLPVWRRINVLPSRSVRLVRWLRLGRNIAEDPFCFEACHGFVSSPPEASWDTFDKQN